MKKIVIMILCIATFTGCGVYGKYHRPKIETEGLYRDVNTEDSTSLGQLSWKEVFTDPMLQTLIEEGLQNNTDLEKAHWRVKESEATLKSARLSYLPSFNVAPQGSISSFDNANTVKTYNIPLTASWEVDIFFGLTNAKRRAKAIYEQSQEYEQAVRTQVIASVANLYYTLTMLDRQHEISLQTAQQWKESVRTMKAMMDAGMANEAAVAQYTANQLAVEASVQEMELQIRQVENSLATLLGRPAQAIERGNIDCQEVPETLSVGIPVQMLTMRPDVRAAEYSLMQAYYATNASRSALYPKLTLNGSVGWSNNGGGMIVNPGKLLLSAAGSLLQPIFNAGALRAKVKISKAQQEQAMLNFRQTLLNAGAEVNNALKQCQVAKQKCALREHQIEALERAVESTTLLMQHGPTTYLEVLVAKQSLLSAQLAQTADQMMELQGVVNLYHALGGGRLEESEDKK